MQAPWTADRLRIYVGERDHWHGHTLPDAVLHAARAQGLAGATVLRGAQGYGSSHHMHSQRPFSISPDLPIVIEIVDTPERIGAFLPVLQSMLGAGALITVEPVRVVLKRRGGKDLPAAAGPG